MANETTVAEIIESIPDIIRNIALKARYKKVVVKPHVLHVDKEISKMGDRVSVIEIPKLSTFNVPASGAITVQVVDPTSIEVVINKHKGIAVKLTDQASEQSALDLVKELTLGFGEALAEEEDTMLLALESSVTADVGAATPVAMSDAVARAAKLTLDLASVPMEDRVFVLSPQAEDDLLALARFSEAQNTGFSRGLQVEKGRISALYGYPVLLSNLVAQITKNATLAWSNLYFHKESIGMATQKNFKMEVFPRSDFGTTYGARIMFGGALLRNSHAVKFPTLRF